MSRKVIGINDTGHRVGESHGRAVLTWADAELIRALHEDYGISYGQLAEKFTVSKSTVRDICDYRTWVEMPVAVRVSREPRESPPATELDDSPLVEYSPLDPIELLAFRKQLREKIREQFGDGGGSQLTARVATRELRKAIEVHRLRAAGLGCRRIARRVGMHYTSVARILRGERWPGAVGKGNDV